MPLVIYVRERERNVLFNDALNTFYLRLYGVRHMVKDHSDSEKGNPLPPHRLLLSINSKGSFICTIPQTGYHIPRPLLHQSWSTGYICEKMCFCIWPINSCDLFSDSICVVDTIIFNNSVGSDKKNHDLFVQNRIVKNDSSYLRNEHLNPPHFLWFISKVKCCSIFYPWCECRLKRSTHQL